TGRALQTHADDLRTVRSKMRRAREVALDGGLTINGYTIEQPGPAPVDPIPLPKDKPVTPAQETAHSAAVTAQDAFARKAKAYAQAAQIVNSARDKESSSQHILVRFLSGVLDPVKLSITLTDVTGGVLGATAVQTSKYKEA